MVDLEGKDKGNISLPPRLQSPDVNAPDFVDEEHKLQIINMQKAFYDIQISDKEKRIQRLENRISELLQTSTDTEAVIKTLDIETADQIAYLNRQISVQTDKIEEHTRNINFVEKLRKEEKEVHLRNVNSINEKYEATRLALTSKIKALNAQINTLEDYKLTREELREKLRIRDEIMAQNEKEVAERLEAVDRKFKIDREKLKNEMYNRLLALSGTLQLEIANVTSFPVHRLIRENIFIKNELMRMVDESLKKKQDYRVLRSVEAMRSNKMKTDSREKINSLNTIRLQKCLLKVLKDKHSEMKKRLENLASPDVFAQEKYDNLAESVRLQAEAFEARRRKLEVILHQESVKFTRSKFIHSQAQFRAKKYEEILYDLKYAIASALKMAEGGEDILDMNENQLLFHLSNIIVHGKSQIQCLGVASVVSVPRPNDVYTKGDLGFDPNHVDFEDSEIVKELSEESIGILNILKAARLPKISLEEYGDDFEEEMEESTEESSKSEATIPSKESKAESSELRENISIFESVEDEEAQSESEESVNGESDGEEQE